LGSLHPMPVILSHIAIACPSFQEIAEKLEVLSLKVKEKHEVPSEKVRVAMLPLRVSPQLCIELLEPTSTDSPISRFLEKKPQGGIHHLSFQVEQIDQWYQTLKEAGFEILPPGIRKAARGRALFIHPKSFGGVLVELEQIEHS